MREGKKSKVEEGAFKAHPPPPPGSYRVKRRFNFHKSSMFCDFNILDVSCL